jgi:DNA-binding beta-propeller fold protein YncE
MLRRRSWRSPSGSVPHLRKAAPSVYVTNYGGGSVSQYDVGPGGALSPKSPATVPAGRFPERLAVSPDGGSVYVAN